MKKVVLLSVLFIFTSLLFSQGEYECLDCHQEHNLTKFVNDSTEISVFVDTSKIAKSVHADLECTDCHVGTENHPNEKALPEPACTSCHEDEGEEYNTSIHGKAYHLGDKAAANCWDCHGGHEIVEHTASHQNKMIETCGKCHSDPEIMAKFGRREMDPVATFKQSIHGKIFLDDPAAPVANCISCHGSHDIKGGIDPTSKLNKLNIPKTCGTCHEDEEKEYYQSIHWASIQRGHYEAPVCTDCHGEHNIHLAEGKNSLTNNLLQPTKLCASCHSSKTMMERFGLDARRLDSYMKSYHGLAVLKGSPEAATCTSCHEVHSIRSSRDSLSSVYPANRKQTCGTCHQNITEDFAQIDVHPLDMETRNPIAYLFKRIYFWLILVVIGGMLAHNILILVHHVREKRKKELGQIRVTRFQSFEVYQHLIMLTSFLTLAVTGFALKFPDAGWVQLLVSLGMTEAIRSVIHRVAAMGLAVTSVIQLVYFIFTKKGRHDFLSLLPNIDDVIHVWQNIRYNLGLSNEKPQFGRYDYGEKAEYLALIWGNMVMGATGFILWFPETFIGFMPTWVFETSEVIHYFEAWLAILAIIVWHWFFVFIHPDNAPVNLTFMDGKITEENLKHHHPKEYERLKKEQNSKED